MVDCALTFGDVLRSVMQWLYVCTAYSSYFTSILGISSLWKKNLFSLWAWIKSIFRKQREMNFN